MLYCIMSYHIILYHIISYMNERAPPRGLPRRRNRRRRRTGTRCCPSAACLGLVGVMVVSDGLMVYVYTYIYIYIYIYVCVCICIYVYVYMYVYICIYIYIYIHTHTHNTYTLHIHLRHAWGTPWAHFCRTRMRNLLGRLRLGWLEIAQFVLTSLKLPSASLTYMEN